MPARTAARIWARRSPISVRTVLPSGVSSRCRARRLPGCGTRRSRPAASSRSQRRLAAGSAMPTRSARPVRVSSCRCPTVLRAFSWCAESRGTTVCPAEIHSSTSSSTASAVRPATASGRWPGAAARFRSPSSTTGHHVLPANSGAAGAPHGRSAISSARDRSPHGWGALPPAGRTRSRATVGAGSRMMLVPRNRQNCTTACTVLPSGRERTVSSEQRRRTSGQPKPPFPLRSNRR